MTIQDTPHDMTLALSDLEQAITAADSAYRQVPPHMTEGLRRYIEDRVQPGSFLYYVLCNDLKQAAAHADDMNSRCLFAYPLYLYNHAPVVCWGSPERVEAWLNRTETTPEP